VALGHAQYITGPVASGLGGAGRGAADDGEQLFLNPAAIVHGSPFTSSLFYVDGYTGKNEHDRHLGFSLADNTEELLCSGGYTYVNRRRTFDESESLDEDFHQISLGGYVYKHLALGMAITYLRTDIEGGSSFDQIDANLGFHYNPHPDWGFGLVFYSLASRDEKVPVTIQNHDKVAVGLHYLFKPTLRVRFDIANQLVYNPENKLNYQVGFETRPTRFFVTRVGIDKDDLAERDYLTLGFGFDGPRLKFDYYYRKDVDYSGGALHGVDLRMPFW
jgi:hypothetical protein